jgi:DNA-binding XRE family transcriptional regulator
LKLDPDETRSARERLGLTAQMVAEKAGLMKASVLRAEHGEDVRPSTARKLAEALKVEVADLYAEPFPTGKVLAR